MNSNPPFPSRLVAARVPASLSPNERQILSLIHNIGPVSRAELARQTGLALPTIIRLTDQLMQTGLVAAEQKVMMSSRGQPSLPLILAPDGAYAFGACVRSDRLTLNLIDLSGKVLADRSKAVDAVHRSHVEQRITALCAELVTQAAIDPLRVAGIGIALSGFFVGPPWRINAPLGMDDWAVEDLDAALGERFGLPVLVENDGSAAAVGERIYGLGRTVRSFAYAYVDRGFGGGLVIDGRLWRGRNGNAGEFTGVLPPAVRPHRPTLKLLLEMLAQDGIAHADIPAMLSGYDPAWPAIDRWVKRVTPQMDMVLSAISAVTDVDAVVVGGRLPDDLAQRLIDASACFSVGVRGRDRAFPDMHLSQVGGDAAALGAAALIFDRHFF